MVFAVVDALVNFPDGMIFVAHVVNHENVALDLRRTESVKKYDAHIFVNVS